MLSAPRTLPAALWIGLAASSVAFAHDDDPKILALKPPYAGAGFRPGALLPGGPGLPSPAPGYSIRFPSSGVQLLSWLPAHELGLGDGGGGNDCWGYVSPSGREYALMGHGLGTAVVEISDPSSPEVIAALAGPGSLWRDIKVHGEYAYAVSEGGEGIQVIDLSQVDSGVASVVNTVITGGAPASHNVAIDEDSGFLYRCGGQQNGLRIYSLADPTNPTYVSQWTSRYVHDAQIVTYTSGPYAGRQIAFCCSGLGNGGTQTGLTILDVTNKSSIFVRAQFYYSNGRYSHQAWLSPDRQYLYLNDEKDESNNPTRTVVIDVSDIDNPFQAGAFTNGNKAISHNLYTKDDRMFAANYRSGMRVFDVSSPTNGTEIAWFDTWPEDDWNTFNGLWSVYPYFPSGVVIGSDLEKGLFVWWVGERLVDFAYPGGLPAFLDAGGETVALELSEASPGDLEAGTASLFYDAGSGWVEAPLVNQGGGAFEADFPALPCGQEVFWFVAARSTNGILWADPPEAPYTTHRAVVASDPTIVLSDDFETDQGWTAGAPGDDATAGTWKRLDPVGNSAQPEDDHSTAGTHCYVTGNGNDVDGGHTTLTSPAIDVSDLADPRVSFWLWFHKDGTPQPSDRIRITVSNDDGASWVLMEVVNQTPATALGSWRFRSYRIADFVEPTDQVRVRFRVWDTNLDTRVEAGVDDFVVFDTGCESDPTLGTRYCTPAVPNSTGESGAVFVTGSDVVADDDLTLTALQLPPEPNIGYFIMGTGMSTFTPPGANGPICVSPGIKRFLPPVNNTSELDGGFERSVGTSGPISGNISPGSTWNFQAWHRDSMSGASNLTDAISVEFN